MSNSVLKDYDEGARERELLLFQSKIQNIIGIILLYLLSRANAILSIFIAQNDLTL